jgi:uncharacterized protein (TIGR00297 family)
MVKAQSSFKLGNFVEMEFPYLGHLGIIVMSVIFTMFLGKAIPKHVFLARKILHVSAISAVAHAVYITQNQNLYIFRYSILASAVVLTLAVISGFFTIDGRKSWGIAYFPWVLWIMLLLIPNQKEYISVSFAVLAVSDGFSAIAGRYVTIGFLKRNQTMNGKTWIGFVVFTLCAWVVLMGFFSFGLIQSSPGVSTILLLTAMFFIAISTAAVELLSSRGTDNLWIPMWVFLLLFWQENLEMFIHQKALYLLPVALLSCMVVWKKWLTLDGLFTALLLAMVIVLSGLDLTPLLIFFLLGSLASKANKNKTTDRKHGRPRDMGQVLANGGWVGIIALLNPLAVHLGLIGTTDARFFVWVLMSAALGDTLSSELGMRYGKTPYSLRTFKPVPMGLSGGISFMGLWGAFLGGLVMTLYLFLDMKISLNIPVEEILIDNQYNQLRRILGFVLFSGLGGSLLDSVLGEFLQERFQKHGILSDVGIEEERISGIRGISNDWINFISLGIWFFLSLCWVVMYVY